MSYSNKLDLSNYFIVDSSELESQTSHNHKYDETSSKIRGLIFKNQDDKVLVASTFPYTEEFSVSNIDVVDSIIKEGTWKYYKSYEGTVIRIIHDEQDGVMKRVISTHKKLDAFESYWGSDKSYGELFKTEIDRMHTSQKINNEHAFNDFLDSLDSNYNYTFLLLSNDDNKIVASHNNKILFIGCFERNNHKYTTDVNISFLHFERPEEIEIKTTEDIMTYVTKVVYKDCQGVIAIRQDDFKLFKVINDKYKEKSMLRGNNSNLIYRYFFLKKNDQDMFIDYLDLFSNKKELFLQSEYDFLELCKYVHMVYYQRHIMRSFVFVNPVFHSILKKIHTWHLLDKKNNICTLDAVIQHVSDCDSKTLFYLLKEMKNNPVVF
jgi:hypothetical protein